MSIIEPVANFMIIFGYSILFFGIILMFLSIFNYVKTRKYKLDLNYEPKISLIVPAHNEEDVIERTIKKFIDICYPEEKKEMIIINDGSIDKTEYIVAKYAGKIINSNKLIIDKPGNHFNIILIDRDRGDGGKGKSFALNDGKLYANGELLFFIDADIQLNTDTFKKVASHFIDETVDVLTGYVKVGGNRNVWSKFIDFEYLIGQHILRRGYNFLGVHYVIPGGFGVFRKKLLDAVGDFHHDTLAEDTDLSWRIITETKAKIHHDPSIEVIADEPTMLIGLWNQRVRWARGNIEVTLKNRHKVGKNKYGRGLTWVYPFWLSSMLLPFAFISGATGFILIATINGKFFSDMLHILGLVLAISFYLLWCVGILINKGKSWLEGLLTPGIPILINITTILLSKTGIVGILNTYTHPQIGTIVGFILGIWIFISIPGTYLCLFLAKKGKTKIADTFQLIIIGYWMFLIVTILHAFYSELVKDDRKWIRTVR